MTSIIWIFGSLMSSNFVIKCNCSIGFFLMMVWLLFIIDLMGLFFYNKIGSIISIGDLPTTNIIEPLENRFETHQLRLMGFSSLTVFGNRTIIKLYQFSRRFGCTLDWKIRNPRKHKKLGI